MIIDTEKRFVFVKTKKTASTSLEIALSCVAGPDAIVTPIKEEDEKKRVSMGALGAQNYKPGDNCFVESRAGLPKYAKRGFYNHMTAWDIRRIIGVEYNDFFSISIIRNPWDRCISHYHWSTRGKQLKPSFREFLRKNPETVNCNEKILFHPVKSELMVDFVIRYEHLREDLISLQRKFDLPKLNLFDLMQQASSKTNVKPKKENPYAIYCDFSNSLVEMLCEKEIEAFNL